MAPHLPFKISISVARLSHLFQEKAERSSAAMATRAAAAAEAEQRADDVGGLLDIAAVVKAEVHSAAHANLGYPQIRVA